MFHTSLSRKHVTQHDHNTRSFAWGSSATRAETAPAVCCVEREGLVVYKIKTYDLFSTETATVKPWKKFIKRPESIIY